MSKNQIEESNQNSTNATEIFDNITDQKTVAKFNSLPGIAQKQSEFNDLSWKSNELTVGSLILVYGIFVIVISAWLMMKGKDAEAVLRMVAVISAVIIASFLLIVGYDSQQMNPVIGLLGTIVGYLLGKDQGYNAGTRDGASRKQV